MSWFNAEDGESEKSQKTIINICALCKWFDLKYYSKKWQECQYINHFIKSI